MLLDIYSAKQLYYEEYDSFCYQNCIRQILEHFQVINARFYINTSLSLLLKKEDKFEYDIMYHDNARSVLPEYKEKVRRYYPGEKSKYEVWEENLQNLRLGLPIITGVDSYFLDYLPYYNSSHGIHTVILAGYSEKEQKVELIDWFAPWFFKGSVDFKNYIEARDSENIYDGGIYSGYPIKNNWAEIDNSGWNTDSLELIRANINLSINQYYTNYKNEHNVLNGIYALKSIVDILENIKILDNEGKKRELKKLYYNLYGTVKRKVFFKHFLENAYKETKIEIFKESKDFIMRIINQWENLLNVIMKGIFRCKDETLVKINVKLVNLIKQEEELYEYLFKLSCILH